MNKILVLMVFAAMTSMVSCAGGKKGCNGSWYGKRNTQIKAPVNFNEVAILQVK